MSCATSSLRVYSGSRGLTGAYREVVGFILVRVNSRTLLNVAKSIRVRVGSLWRDRCRDVDWGSRGFTRARIGVIGFIWVRVGSLCRS